MITIFISVIILAAISPSIYCWRRQLRLRHLAEARRDIAKSVTEMERLMLKGDIQLGDVSHDFLFQKMRAVQYADDYEVDWTVLKKPSDKARDIAKKLEHELDQEDCPFANNLRQFLTAYFKAFRSRRPFISRFYILYMQILNKSLKYFLMALLLSAVAILALGNTLFRSKKESLYRKASKDFFSQSKAILQS